MLYSIKRMLECLLSRMCALYESSNREFARRIIVNSIGPTTYYVILRQCDSLDTELLCPGLRHYLPVAAIARQNPKTQLR